MSHFRPTLWLVACVFITCYGRQGTQCLAAVLAANSGFSSSGQPGIVFPSTSNDAAYQQQSVADASRDDADGDLPLYKRLRLDDLDTGSPSYSRLSTKELMRRARINELLAEISSSIPRSSGPTKYSRPAQQQQQQQPAQEPRPRSGLVSQNVINPYSDPRQQQQQMQLQRAVTTPIQRSGRTFPPSHDQMRYAAQAAGGGASLAPRAGPFQGLVWTPDGQVKVRVLPSAWAGVAGQDREAGANAARAMKMLGNQEIPMPTPLHALPKGDYETKRVETSRGWNNLRGMWGKRSAAAPQQTQQQQQTTAAIQQQQLLNEAAAAAVVAASGLNYDSDGDGGLQQRQQQQQPAPISIRPM